MLKKYSSSFGSFEYRLSVLTLFLRANSFSGGHNGVITRALKGVFAQKISVSGAEDFDRSISAQPLVVSELVKAVKKRC